VPGTIVDASNAALALRLRQSLLAPGLKFPSMEAVEGSGSAGVGGGGGGGGGGDGGVLFGSSLPSLSPPARIY